MDENDYIELQTLLAKLRVVAMKEMADPNVITKVKQKDLKIVRNIDYLRNNAILHINGGTIS